MVFMRLVVGFLLISLLSVAAYGQHFSSSPPQQPFHAADTHSLFFSIDNANFLKNNEYYNDYVAGYTKLGFFAEPRLNWILSEKTRLSAGVHLLRYSGNQGFHKVQPVFSLHHRFSPGFRLIMGTLENQRHHNLIDPIYHYENYLDRHTENGLQLLLNTQALEGEAWINWQQFIFRESDFQEQFETGVSADVSLYNHKDIFSVGLPLQMLIQHRGGQINRNDTPISTLYNTAAGLSLKFGTGWSWLESLRLDNHMVFYGDASPQKRQPYSNGHAFYSKLSLDRKPLGLEISYWQARQYLSFAGNPMFQAFSVKKDIPINPNRQLVTGRLHYGRDYKGLKVVVNADGYWDTRRGTVDFGFGLYLLLDTHIFLTNTSGKHPH